MIGSRVWFKEMKKLLFGFVLIITLMGTVVATDYYVSPTGDDSNTGTSVESAWRTLSYACSQLTAGDTLWVVNGTYQDDYCSLSASGTSTSWITIRAYNGTPVINGTFNETAGTCSPSYAVRFNYNDYIRIIGLRIRYVDDGLVRFGSHVKVEDVDVGQICGYAIFIDSHLYAINTGNALNHIWINNSSIHDTAINGDTGPNLIHIAGAQADEGEPAGHHIFLYNNNIYGSGLHQILNFQNYNPPDYTNVGLHSVFVINNTIHDLGFNPSGMWTIYGALVNSTFENNTFQNINKYGIAGQMINVTFRNNILNNTDGLYLWGKLDNCIFENNIIRNVNNYFAFGVYDGINTTFRNNTVEGVHYGRFRGSSTNHTIENQTQPVSFILGSGATIMVSYPSGRYFELSYTSGDTSYTMSKHHTADGCVAKLQNTGTTESYFTLTPYNFSAIPQYQPGTITLNSYDLPSSLNFTANFTTASGNVNFSVWSLRPNHLYTIKRSDGKYWDGSGWVDTITAISSGADGEISFSNSEWSTETFVVTDQGPVGEPLITSVWNSVTQDSSSEITIEEGTTVEYRVVADQTINTWTWSGVDSHTGDGSDTSEATKYYGTPGTFYVTVYGSNANGNTQTVTWTIDVNRKQTEWPSEPTPPPSTGPSPSQPLPTPTPPIVVPPPPEQGMTNEQLFAIVVIIVSAIALVIIIKS
ncbi:hypothetical protein DRP07_00065 [Archaeoglobales archaeon]|nr:MAG: hypothetical protein DRP07_00065 [Archaeoglobales archaeon]